MSKPLIYVAGPIAGQSYEGAVDWRDYVQQRLPECEILTPMRGKEYLRQLPSMPLTSASLISTAEFTVAKEMGIKMSALEEQVSSMQAIHRRDTWDVERCDLVFANFLPGDELDRPSIGTACEVYLAAYLHTPVVEVLTRNGIHDHPFITGSAWVVVETVEEGVHAARMALNLEAI